MYKVIIILLHNHNVMLIHAMICNKVRQALLWLQVNDQLVIKCNDSRRPCLMLVMV